MSNSNISTSLNNVMTNVQHLPTSSVPLTPEQLQTIVLNLSAKVEQHSTVISELLALQKENALLKSQNEALMSRIKEMEKTISSQSSQLNLFLLLIDRSEVRSRLRRAGVDTGRVLDISFPASGVLGVLVHTQYVQDFIKIMTKAQAEVIKDFDPLDPLTWPTPSMILCLRPPVPKKSSLWYTSVPSTLFLLFVLFLLLLSVAPSLRRALWNANGLRATTVHDVLSTLFALMSSLSLKPGLLLVSCLQTGLNITCISCLVSPSCPFPVHQLPSYNAHTLSMKIGKVTVHCLYLPPSLSNELVFSVLNSLPLSSDTVLCGDFNARLGALTGDLVVNPRGRSLLPWLEERSLRVLNSELAHGVATFTTFRRNVEVSSIIDLFITNIPASGMVSPSLVVESDLSLGSDHRLMFLSFGYIPPLHSAPSSGVLAPRRLWNLSRLNEVDPLLLYQSRFRSLVAPLQVTLDGLVSSPPGVRPPIDSLNDSLNECFYRALDDSIGQKAARPGHWHKYWTADLEAAARERDRRYQLSKATATMARLKRRKLVSASYTHPDGPQSAVNTMAAHLAKVYDGSLLSSADRPAAPPDFSGMAPFVSGSSPLVPDSDLGIFSVPTLLRLIKQLPNRKAPGRDHLKAEMLKAVAKDLAPVLSSLFQICYQWCYTPAVWRQAQVFPIHKKAASHSFSLGYRWNPSKCAVLNAPSVTSSTSFNFRLRLYGEPLPTVDEFIYLGVPFRSKGLYGPGILALRSSGAVKTMALLNSVGVNRNGFSLLLSSRLYTCFIRPKLEYGLAISRLTSSDVKAFDKLQNRLVGMFLGSSWVNVAKHITCILPFHHRYKVLMTRYVLRSRSLADDCLVVLLRDSLRYSRLVKYLSENSLYRSLPDPLPVSSSALKALFDSHWQEQFDRQMSAASTSGKFVLLRACRPSVSQPDPILYLPMSRTARSRLVRWRLGRFTNMDEECPCSSGARLTRDHILVCRAVDSSLVSQLPVSPPGVNRIDHALNCLPLTASSGPPPFWSALLSLLYVVDTLSHPSAHIAPDPDPGDSWLSVSCSRR
ncbi:uncharacterized protein BX663DRAFT_490376 [Cokeromyces recurvatus]|uniref:uncharacterized protein n=1 Tax=Cokeromyces recurvatus TaxID=90255 RepID=UPI00221EDF18|nr:uncharacterized protein BX663DRAFT_490376 [Cokeromyces recurvatus]KAI7897993.1 hypothetical protein BX663DRAFT_490376 [Cokeromyces recurvatus]